MKMIIDYAGNRYETETTSVITADTAKEQLFENFEHLTKLALNLKDGGYLLLGREAVQRCAVQILEA